MTRGDVTTTSDDDLARAMAVNVEAPLRISRAAVPIMAAGGGGAIVNIASCWGLRPGPAHAVYCMTKAALASLTQCMGMDHAGDGVRINAVCPNEVDTPMLSRASGTDPGRLPAPSKQVSVARGLLLDAWAARRDQASCDSHDVSIRSER